MISSYRRRLSKGLSRRSREERGAYFLEVVIVTPILFFMIFATLMTWITFTYAMLAQDTLVQTAMSVSSNGTWTTQQRLTCERLLPGSAFVNGTLDTNRYCKVYKATSSSQTSVNQIISSGEQMKAICPDWNTLNRTPANPYYEKEKGNLDKETGGIFKKEVHVKDCLNESGEKGRFAPYIGHDQGTGAVPLVVEISYQQFWLPTCFLTGTSSCSSEQLGKNNVVKRAVVIFSQTRRES